MAVQSTVPAFLAALRVALAARPGLSGVRVDLVPTGDTSGKESILLVNGRIEGGQERLAMKTYRDSYRVPGLIDARATHRDSDVAFQAAFDRAGAILNEVLQQLNGNTPQVGAVTLDATVETIGYRPFIGDNGGWVCLCDFVIDYQAETA